MERTVVTLSDAELVRLCRAGDPDAWNLLVERFSRYVYAIATKGYRLSDADAEDVFQDLFTRVYTRLDSLRDDSALRPWIGQLTRRLCIDALSAGALEEPRAEPVDLERESVLQEIEEAFDLRDALAELPDHCQDMLDRFFTRDESYKTISTELDLPLGTIASRIARCLGKLRARLETNSAEENSPRTGLGDR
jgi:RNA polymerase sigma factor (sigma-70 family)